MKKVFVLFLILCITLLAACQQQASSSAQEPSPEPGAEAVREDDIYIFFTSDVHCGVSDNVGYAGVKALVDDTRAEHEYVTLVDLGDFLQGGTMGTLSNGRLIVEIMNAVGYDLATFGNHEFDYGMEELGKRVQEADQQMIASNVVYSGTKGSVFAGLPEYVIKDYGGTKVAFLGILTPESRTSSTPKFFMEDGEFVYDFYSGNDGQDLYDRVQSLVDTVRAEGADHVIVLAHLGSEIYAAPFDSISLISHTEGIDVVLDGHSHSLIVADPYPNKNQEDVILSSVGTKLQAVGEVIIGTDGTIDVLHIEEYGRKDEGVLAVIDKANEEIDAILNEKITELDFSLPDRDENGIRMSRTRETTVADFCADAFRTAGNADIGLINGGGARATIKAGDVNYGDLLNVMPFQNHLAVVEASGQQVLDALEYGCRFTEKLYVFDENAVGEYGGFLQVSGLRYTIDTSVESSVMTDENGMFAGYADEQRRVRDVEVLEDGQYVPLDPEKTYIVASTEYILLESGDGNTAFSGSQPIAAEELPDIEVMRSYITDPETDMDQYRQTQGRITVE